ncbi:MAG: hypothetical protein RIS36_1512 [Pseudomonadota bacterium]
MRLTISSISLTVTTAALSLTAATLSAEPFNPSPRSLTKMSRRGDPTVSMQSLATVCPTVKKVTGREFLWKSQISDHISSQDPRSTGPTFICNKLCPKTWPMNFYYSDGMQAGAVGYYGVYRVTKRPRAYCAVKGARKCFVSRIATNSNLAGRDGKVYLKISDTTCYQVPPIGRTGSVY